MKHLFSIILMLLNGSFALIGPVPIVNLASAFMAGMFLAMIIYDIGLIAPNNTNHNT